MYKPTVLYAEDDQETRENLSIILHQYFDTVYTAQNGKEALELYHEQHPDILLLDIRMPCLDGLDVARIVRQADPNIPIVILSAYSDREKLLDAVNLKLEAYLLKPINNTELKETITKLISRTEGKETVRLRKGLVWNNSSTTLMYEKKEIKLTKKERLLLCILTKHIGKYISNDELIIYIWQDDIPDHSHDNKLIQLIYRLNKKITQALHCDTHIIENSYTLGYRIVPS
jgi:DNA-binding response OmpR family regulator